MAATPSSNFVLAAAAAASRISGFKLRRGAPYLLRQGDPDPQATGAIGATRWPFGQASR